MILASSPRDRSLFWQIGRHCRQLSPPQLRLERCFDAYLPILPLESDKKYKNQNFCGRRVIFLSERHVVFEVNVGVIILFQGREVCYFTVV
jgi:hypothetical protein